MSSQITLLKDFTNGQGAGFDDYFDYAPDHDANYLKLENESNQQANELTALQGGGAFINYDLVRVGVPASPGGSRQIGVIGAHSYRVTINGDTTKLDVTAGSALIAGNSRVEAFGATLLTTPGGAAAEHFVAIDVNGFPSIQILPGLKAMDVASATWDSAEYTNVTAFQNIGTQLTDDLLATIMFDGDAHIEMLSRPATGNLSKKIFLRPDNRLHAIEQILQGTTTDDDGDPIGTPQLDATWITTGVLAHERGGLEFDASAVVDGDFVVGTGTGTMGLESGNTARTSLGLGTGDTPQFSNLGLGTPAGSAALTADGVDLRDAGGSTVIEISGTDLLGFFGVTPVTVQSLTGEATLVTLAEVITVLDNLIGLFDASALGLIMDDRT